MWKRKKIKRVIRKHRYCLDDTLDSHGSLEVLNLVDGDNYPNI